MNKYLENAKRRKEIKKWIRPEKQRRRKSLISLPNFWITIGMAAISVLCLVLSFTFHVKGHMWLPNAFLSVSCGFITGLALYFLTNLRNNKANALQKDYDLLSQLESVLSDIHNIGKYYNLSVSLLYNDNNELELGNKVFDYLYDLEEIRNKLPSKLYKKLGFLEKDPFDYDSMKELRRKYYNALDNEKEMRIWLVETDKEFISAFDTVRDALNTKKEKLTLLGRYFF